MRFLRMVKSELRRLLSDKKFLITFFAVLAFFIVLITVALLRLPMDYELPEKVDLGELMAKWQANYEESRAWYLCFIGEGPNPQGNGVPFGDADYFKQEMEHFRFLLSEASTDTYKEYYFYFEINNENAIYRGFYTLMLMMKYMFYPLIIFAIISAVVLCVSPYDKGIMKNYLAAPVGKRTVMGGKLFVLGLVNFIFWLIFLIWGLIIGAGNASVKVLFYSGERYYAQPILATFTLVMLQMLVAMLFTGILTVFIGQYIKKPLATSAAAVFAVIFILCLCGLCFLIEPWQLVQYPDYGYAKYFPVIGLYGIFQNAHDYRLWVALLFHIAVGAGMAAFIILWQDKNLFISRRKTLDRGEG